jgi:hypothetical protein
MSWMNALSGILSQMGGGQIAPEQAENHFDQISQMLPAGTLGGGLADAFRSSDTPPFAQLASQLFGNSGGEQKAGMLNAMLSSVGPSLLSGAAGGVLGQFLGGGKNHITPEEAEQIPPEAVQEIAAKAEQHNPSVVDQLGSFYSQHPTLVKTLGGAVLAVALAKLSERQQG